MKNKTDPRAMFATLPHIRVRKMCVMNVKYSINKTLHIKGRTQPKLWKLSPSRQGQNNIIRRSSLRFEYRRNGKCGYAKHVTKYRI
jgi:hypothetical protein